MIDAIKNFDKDVYEFFYCLAINNCHSLKNLSGVGNLNAREIKYISNEILGNPEKYKIRI